MEPGQHRLFCEISKNWAGRPLDNYETILQHLRTTRTVIGLRVRAHLVRRAYETGVKVTDAQMKGLRLTRDRDLPKWNYSTIQAARRSRWLSISAFRG